MEQLTVQSYSSHHFFVTTLVKHKSKEDVMVLSVLCAEPIAVEFLLHVTGITKICRKTAISIIAYGVVNIIT